MYRLESIFRPRTYFFFFYIMKVFYLTSYLIRIREDFLIVKTQ